jgi:phosphoenolpyruvate synthase/pyruvate phosphate dikinase
MLDSPKKEFGKKTREKYLLEISEWEDSLMFISEEIKFLGKLLNAGIFEPNIPNLYERLQQYLKKLQGLKNQKILLEKEIERYKTDFDKELGQDEEHKYSLIKRTHLQLRKNMKEFSKNISSLKLEIFNYTGTILKKSK